MIPQQAINFSKEIETLIIQELGSKAIEKAQLDETIAFDEDTTESIPIFKFEVTLNNITREDRRRVRNKIYDMMVDSKDPAIYMSFVFHFR